MSRKLILFIFISCLASFFFSCGKREGALEYRSTQGLAWGTEYHITYEADSDLTGAILQAIERVNLTLSPFVDSSEISRINRGEPCCPSHEFREVFALSQRVCSISGGLFDPTVAPLINLWGFGYGKAAEGLQPSQAAIDSALLSVGILDCSIDSGRMVKKADATEFNFSAIAKGYGVDMIAAALREEGCKNYMVEVGGEVDVQGVSPRGTKWRIQIDAPVPDTMGTLHQRMAVISITDCGVATSGNYRNYRIVGDKQIGHTISPLTGRPIQSNTLSATVVAPSCALADALATAAMAMPDTAAMRMLESMPEVEAVLAIAVSDSLTTRATSGFGSMLNH